MNTLDPKLVQSIEKALQLQQTQHVDEAIALFKAVLQKAPTQADALHGLGMAYAQKKHYTNALRYLTQAVQQAPNIAEFHNNLGNALKIVGDIEMALTHYHEALRLKPNYAQAHNNLGSLLYKLGKYEQALEHFQKSLRMDPGSVDTHYNVANTYIQLNRLLDAVPHYSKVLEERPDHLGALHNLGITLCVLKRFDEAAPHLEKVVAREENIDALYHLGIIKSAQSKPLEAKDYYEKVLALSPQHSHCHHNLATLLLQEKQRDEALKHFKIAYELEPSNKTAKHMIDALLGKPAPEGAPFEYTRALFDQYAYNYDQHVKQSLKYNVPALMREAIAPYVQTANAWQVLDLGCGSGLCAPLFSDIAQKLIGIDVSANMLEIARQRGGYYKLHHTDIMSYLAVHKNEFELILAADVLVYFGSLSELFTACARALKPQGLFCFSTERLSEQESEASPEQSDYQLRKTGRYAHTQAYVEHLIQASGFSLLEEKACTLRYQEEEPMLGTLYIVRR